MKSSFFLHPIARFLCLCGLLGCGVAVQAGDLDVDSLPPNRYTTHATMFGVGGSNQYETYLSPMEYTGPQLTFLRETLRKTRLADYRITVQTMWNGYLTYASNPAETADELGGAVGYNAAWHYNWLPLPGLRLMAGGGVGGDVGFLYNMRNSNNPAQARLSAALSASVAAIYRFRLGGHPFAVRYQADAPLMGGMFSPNYGQSYYELFSEGDYDHNVCFTHPGNAFSLRQLLTLDFPVGRLTFRVGYLCDIRQSEVNHLRSHVYNHTFLLGYVKHFSFLKRRDKGRTNLIF